MLGVSLDTLRRWDRAGRITTTRDHANRRLVALSEVERLGAGAAGAQLSARNHLRGTVRSVVCDGLLAQVEIDVAGPCRIVAIVTAEAIESLGLRPGVPAAGVVKATSVMVER